MCREGGGDGITLAEIAALPLVVPSRPHSLRLRIERAAAEAGLALDIALEVDALHSMIETARQGLGFTILPGCAAQRDIDEGVLAALRIEQPALSQTLFVATASQRPAAVSSRRLAALVREAVHGLADTGLWRRVDRARG
jgi:LysR family nitrogen assimilation transcriptional regulator